MSDNSGAEKESGVSQILALSPAATLLLDKNGCILDYNEAALELLRPAEPRENLRGFPFYGLLQDETYQSFQTYLETLLQEESRLGFNLRIEVPEKGIKRFYLISRRLPAGDGILCSLTEMPDIQRMEDDFLLARQVENKGSKIRNLLLSSLRREMELPLFTLREAGEKLYEGTQDETQKKLIGDIRSSALTLGELIGRLDDGRDFSFREVGGGDREKFRLGELIDALDRTAAAEARAKNLTWQVTVDDGIRDISFSGDASGIQEILSKIIDNALRYTDYGRVDFKIGKKDLNEFVSELCFEVRDTGPGISPNRKSRLDQVLSLGENSDLDRLARGGLGLVIASFRAKKMGAQLYYETMPGMGSSFFLSLVLQKEDTVKQEKVLL